MTSSGVHAPLVGDVGDLAADELGVRRRLSATDERVEVHRQAAAAALQLVPRRARATPGSRYAAMRSSIGRSISSRNDGAHVERERLAQVHLEHERPARHLRPHLDALGPRRVVFASMIFSCHGKPLTVSSAVHVSGRPIARWRSNTSACVTFSPGSSATTPLPRVAQRLEQRRQLVEVGDARRHRPAARRRCASATTLVAKPSAPAAIASAIDLLHARAISSSVAARS